MLQQPALPAHFLGALQRRISSERGLLPVLPGQWRVFRQVLQEQQQLQQQSQAVSGAPGSLGLAGPSDWSRGVLEGLRVELH